VNRCVLELHAIISRIKSGGGRFEVAMTIAEHSRFLEESNSSSAHVKLLCNTCVERSECSRESDRKNIHAAIEQTVGFDNLNRSIVEVMERWMMQQFEQQAETLDEEESHMTKAQMARMLSDQGMYEEAMALEEQILAHFKKTLPEHHPNIGLAMSNLAISYRHCERYHQALALHQEALAIFQKSLEPNDRCIGQEYGNMGACYHGLRNASECLRLHKQALQWRRQNLNPDDPAIGMALFSVAAAYAVSSQPELAVQWGQDALQFQRRVLPANHPDTADTLVNLSINLSTCRRHVEAVSAIDDAVALLKRVRAHDHPALIGAMEIQRKIHVYAAQ
jgi:tetratricopeptide (TPR) repeat protein